MTLPSPTRDETVYAVGRTGRGGKKSTDITAIAVAGSGFNLASVTAMDTLIEEQAAHMGHLMLRRSLRGLWIVKGYRN